MKRLIANLFDGMAEIIDEQVETKPKKQQEIYERNIFAEYNTIQAEEKIDQDFVSGIEKQLREDITNTTQELFGLNGNIYVTPDMFDTNYTIQADITITIQYLDNYTVQKKNQWYKKFKTACDKFTDELIKYCQEHDIKCLSIKESTIKATSKKH